MNIVKRVIAIVLTVALSIAVLGCFGNKPDVSKSTPEPTELVTEKPVEKETPAPTEYVTPEPTEPPIDKEAINAQFEALDLEIFTEIVTQSGDIYNQLIVSEPQRFGIEPEEVERGWGDYYTLESHNETIDYFVQMTDRLHAIGKEYLTDTNKVGYDTLVRFCEFTLAYKDFYYYDEPLTPMNGLHTTFPLSMVCFNIRTVEDVEWYLLLLEDMPRIIEQVEQYELGKAENGLFMTEVALDQVIKSCEDFAKTGKDCFLIDYFDEVLEKAYELGLPEEKGAELKQRNDKAIIEGLLPSYSKLAQTLESQRENCGEFVGAAARADLQKEYFLLSLQKEAGTMDSIDDITALVEFMGTFVYQQMYQSIMSDPEAIDRYGEAITFGSTDEDMEWLETYVEKFYPNVPGYEVTYITIPESLADDFSPAAYLTPAYDDYYHNTILLNPTASNTAALSTLAHEAVPGHMYQFLYFRNMEGLSLTQQLLTPTGYAEAWTVFTEYLLAKNCEEIGSAYCTMINCESSFSNIFIPAYISINVNYYGWTVDEVKMYLDQFGIGDAAELLYEYAITMPVYAMSYAIGFSYMLDHYTNVEPKGGAQHMDFFEKYLSYGPTYLDILADLLKD